MKLELVFIIELLWISVVCGATKSSHNPTDTLERRSNAKNPLDVITCAGCEALLLSLKGVAHLGNKAFTKAIVGVCKTFGNTDDDVCAGAIGLEGPIIAHSLRQMKIPSRTSKLFCTTLFGLCEIPPVAPFQVPFPKAKPANLQRPSTSGQKPIKVVHISDIHVDLAYEAGSNYECTKPICCRSYSSGDAPGNTQHPAGPFGNNNCDTPLTLAQSMYAAIEEVAPDAAFTIFTGDAVEGAVWLVNKAEVIQDLHSAYSNMTMLNKVYGVIGNHDVAPTNSFPPAQIETTIGSEYVYDTLSAEWEQWLGKDGSDQVQNQFGAYSVLHGNSKLRIISLNTNFWYKQNFWLYEKKMETDPSGQLAWLVKELQRAEDTGERVFIIGHMPMGSSDVLHDASNYFNQIVQRYDSTISALFFGHTHKDEFQITYRDYKQQNAQTAAAISYIAPALTPTSGHPSFRVYSVDPITFAVLDYTTYYANITSPAFQIQPVWEKLYSIKETYASTLEPSAELTPGFWHNLTETFEKNDSIFQDYYSRKWRGYDNSTCIGECKKLEICRIRAAETQYNCVKLEKGLHWKRDAEPDNRQQDYSPSLHAHECGESRTGEIFAAFAKDADEFHTQLKREVSLLMDGT